MTVRRGGSDRCAITMLSTGDGYTVLGDDIVSYGAVSRCTRIRGARQANDFAFPPSFGGHGASRRTTPMCAIGLRTKAGAVFFIDVVVSASVRLVVAQTAEANLRPELYSRNERLWNGRFWTNVHFLAACLR
jgi:hypothetical protein